MSKWVEPASGARRGLFRSDQPVQPPGQPSRLCSQVVEFFPLALRDEAELAYRSLREIGGGRKGCAAHLGYQTVELRFRERIRNSIRGDGQLVAALRRLEALVGHHTDSV